MDNIKITERKKFAKRRRIHLKFGFPIKLSKIKLKDLKKEEKRKNYRKEIILILLIIAISVTFFSGVSLGKVIHNTNIQSDAEIAKPILEVEKDSEIIITEDNKNGEYRFKVKNYNALEEISEVDLKYYIEILEDNLDNSIQYELYREDEKIELKNNRTEQMEFHKDKKEEQIYTLKVQYNSNENHIGDIIDEIQIKVHSEQLKI